jgi:hypothetical protein
MAVYFRAQDSDTWHWCTNCSHYPTHIAGRRDTRPDWDLCEQCKDKERNGTCQT